MSIYVYKNTSCTMKGREFIEVLEKISRIYFERISSLKNK